MSKPKKPTEPTETKVIDMQSVVGKSHEILDKMSMLFLNELRLVTFCLAHYNPKKENNPTFRAHVQDLIKIFPSMDKKSAYGVIREALMNVNKKPLEFREGNTRHFHNWFRGFSYYEGTGEFEFRINPDMGFEVHRSQSVR